MVSDLSENAEVFIADLGIAVQFDSIQDKSKFRVGTSGFMAPEILLGKPYSFKCDIWSLACVLFNMFYSKLPYHSKLDASYLD